MSVGPPVREPGRAVDEGPDHSARAVLGNQAFRRLWLVLGLSSLGDWLGLLAVTFFAAQLVGGADDLPAASLAVSGVLVLRLAPALLLGPLAGVLADRMDRRTSLVVFDVVRGLLFLSIPLVGTLEWLYVATVLVEVAALFWTPAKDAMVPNLVPRRQLETANQLGVAATYGTAPVAALLFAGLALLSNVLDDLSGGYAAAVASEVDLALYANGVTFLVAAAVIARIRLPEAARGPAARHTVTDGTGPVRPSVWHQVVEGWSFIARTPVVRGLVGGMVGAFAAGGFVIGLGVVYVAGLGAGAPGYAVLFGAVFVGMALGVWQGPRTLRDVSRRRLFGASIGAAGLALVVVGLSPDIVLSALAVLLLGFFAGMAWVTGTTLLGAEVEDSVRGRTFAFVQTAVRVVLIAVMAAGPLLARLVGDRSWTWSDALVWRFSGAGLVMALAGLLAVLVGVLTFRRLDDRPGVPLRAEVAEAVRRGAGDPFDVPRPHPGFFLVVEGGDGAGKSTLAQALRDWLVRELGHRVVLTREPGGTPVGSQVRRLVLDWEDDVMGAGPVPRAEALLFAADRAQHVATVVEPGLAAGAVVLSDRYVDSSVAYQGARGDLAPDEVGRLSAWATDGLRPDLTVVLDVDPVLARTRLDGRDGPAGADRVEQAGADFHEQVRRSFLELAAVDPRRYLVVDATLPREDLLDLVTSRLRRMLPLSQAQLDVMARRLAADERSRAEREPAAVEQARLEQVRRTEVRAQVEAAQERERRWAAEKAAAESELRRHRAQLEEERARAEQTTVMPVGGDAAGVAGTAGATRAAGGAGAAADAGPVAAGAADVLAGRQGGDDLGTGAHRVGSSTADLPDQAWSDDLGLGWAAGPTGASDDDGWDTPVRSVQGAWDDPLDPAVDAWAAADRHPSRYPAQDPGQPAERYAGDHADQPVGPYADQSADDHPDQQADPYAARRPHLGTPDERWPEVDATAAFPVLRDDVTAPLPPVHDGATLPDVSPRHIDLSDGARPDGARSEDPLSDPRPDPRDVRPDGARTDDARTGATRYRRRGQDG